MPNPVAASRPQSITPPNAASVEAAPTSTAEPAPAPPATAEADRAAEDVFTARQRVGPSNRRARANGPRALLNHRGRAQMPRPDQPGDIAVNVRSFHHDETFGGGFHGDRRGFSTDENASARIHSRVVVHEGPDGFSEEIESGGFSDPSFHPVVQPGGQLSLAVSTPEVDARVTGSDENGVALRMDYQGANPLTPPGTPEIDVHSAVTFRRISEERVEVNFIVRGDAFPNAEAFITDHQGNSIFLGAHSIHADQGPLDLVGDEGHPMMEGSLTVLTGEGGVFRGVEYEGRKYTLEEWNARFERQLPEIP